MMAIQTPLDRERISQSLWKSFPEVAYLIDLAVKAW